MEYSWLQKLQNSVKMFFHFEGLSKWKCKSIKKPLTLNLSTITLQISLVMSPLVCNSRGFCLNLQLGNYRISLPGMCSVRKMFLKISQNSQENTCARAFLTQAVFLWTFQNNLELLFLIPGITPTNIDWSVANNWNTLFLWNFIFGHSTRNSLKVPMTVAVFERHISKKWIAVLRWFMSKIYYCNWIQFFHILVITRICSQTKNRVLH